MNKTGKGSSKGHAAANAAAAMGARANSPDQFQFSLKWVMLQTGLCAISLALVLYLMRDGGGAPVLMIAAELIALCGTVGAFIGGWYGAFRLGAAIGLLLSPIIMLLHLAMFGVGS